MKHKTYDQQNNIIRNQANIIRDLGNRVTSLNEQLLEAHRTITQRNEELLEAERFKELLRIIERDFGCSHVDNGAEDAKAIIRHIDEMRIENADLLRVLGPKYPMLKRGVL